MPSKDEPFTPAPLRLALRVEGEWWVAYMALSSTMEGAEEIGRILTNAAQLDPEVKEGFMRVMTQVMTGALKELGATAVSWTEQPAPPSEKAGRA